MKPTRLSKLLREWRAGLALLLLLMALPAFAADSRELGGEDRAALRRQYERLLPTLTQNPFGRPLYLQSEAGDGSLRGDVYAQVDHPFTSVRAALLEPDGWCDALILHFNVKYCRPLGEEPHDRLLVKIGRKDHEPLSDAHGVLFEFSVQANAADHFEASLDADKGPMSTRNYRIVLSAIPISPSQSFLHMRYSYGYGRLGALALRGYLATVGRNKVGFTTVKDEDGNLAYVTGLRGLIERNAMRYYLAIDAYLSHPRHVEGRLQAWFEATERYPRQLHEMDWQTYLGVKRREIRRQLQVRPEEVDRR